MEETTIPQGPHLNSKWVPFLFDLKYGKKPILIMAKTHLIQQSPTWMKLMWDNEDSKKTMSTMDQTAKR